MSFDLMVRYQGKSTWVQLQRLQHFHAFGVHFRRSFTRVTHHLHEFGNHIGGRERWSLQPYPQGCLESTGDVQGHVQTNDQLVGAKLMPRDGSYGCLRLCKLNFCCGHGEDQSSLVAAHYSFSDSPAKLRNLCISSIQYRRYGICSPQECPLVRVKCVPVLSTHYKYRYSQRGYGANCLDPSGPSRFIQLEVVVNDRSQCHAPNECDTKKYMGFLHEFIQSCLKGILA